MTLFSPFPTLLLLWFLGLLGLGALDGGRLLAVAPSGWLLRMPVTLLAGSPFADFRVPSTGLFTVLGRVPCLWGVGRLGYFLHRA